MALDIYVDKNVYLAESFALFGNLYLYEETQFVERQSFSQNSLGIVVRTTTKVNGEFLAKITSPIEWIASPTAGFDHVDVELLQRLNIPFFHSPGCNSVSVMETILSAIGVYFHHDLEILRKQIFFVCGAGNVGTKVIRSLLLLGAEVLVCDPPLFDNGDKRFNYTSMEEAKKADVLIFCVPLNKEGIYKTKHFLDAHFFHSLEKKPLFINTSRGEIVKTRVLLDSLEKGFIRDIIVDVYENEPNLGESELELIEKSFLATPHIAGYSFESKKRATEMIFKQFNAFYKMNKTFPSSIAPSKEESSFFTKPFEGDYSTIPKWFTHLFDIERISKNYKTSFARFFAKTLSDEDKKTVSTLFKRVRPSFHLRRNNAFLIEHDFRHIFETMKDEDQKLLKNIFILLE